MAVGAGRRQRPQPASGSAAMRACRHDGAIAIIQPPHVCAHDDRPGLPIDFEVGIGRRH